jgi:tripartite-type tricarboxylate transporter receptor subunit TctC
MKRRIFLQHSASAAAIVAAPVLAQSTSSRPVRWITPNAVGGPSDLISRRLADLLAPEIGQPVIVENRAGAGGVIAVQEVLRADPDGNTIGLAGPDALISGPMLVASAKYDALTDITKLMQISFAHQALWAHSSTGASTLPELLAFAKANPGAVAAVSWGTGSRAEIVVKALENMYGVKILTVPYRAIGQAMPDLIAGVVQVGHLPPSFAAQMEERGTGRTIAILGRERAPELPRVLSSVEQGINLPLLNAPMWNMAFGPKGMPQHIADRWVSVLRKVTASEVFIKNLRHMTQYPMPDRYGITLEREFAAEQAVIVEVTRNLGIKPS